MDQISVFIADDHELVRYALRTLLEAEPDIRSSARRATARARLRVRRDLPDVLLLDLRMPGVGGVEVCREVRARAPTPRCSC